MATGNGRNWLDLSRVLVPFFSLDVQLFRPMRNARTKPLLRPTAASLHSSAMRALVLVHLVQQPENNKLTTTLTTKCS